MWDNRRRESDRRLPSAIETLSVFHAKSSKVNLVVVQLLSFVSLRARSQVYFCDKARSKAHTGVKTLGWRRERGVALWKCASRFAVVAQRFFWQPRKTIQVAFPYYLYFASCCSRRKVIAVLSQGIASVQGRQLKAEYGCHEVHADEWCEGCQK